MMHGREKSDSAIVAGKPTNKTERSVAEPVERRVGAEGNANRQSTDRAQNRATVSQALERIRKAATAVTPKVGAVCENSARTDLCGGRLVTAVPTAIQGEFSNSGHPPGSRSSAKLNQTGSRSGNAQPLRAEFDEQCLRVFEIGSVEAF